ncbi:MAG: hypothetical protein ACRDD7_04520 [Peptostreptococcaceae bacterium]
MLKLTMNNGDEYDLKELNTIGEFLKKYADKQGNLSHKLIYLNKNTGVNLSQISSIEVSEYIDDSNAIMP